MNRRDAERITLQSIALRELGFTRDEAESLRRISMTLRRWHEHECNGTIQRGEDGVARGYRVNARFLDPNDPRYWYSVPDRERGAKKRLAAILKARNNRDVEGGRVQVGPDRVLYVHFGEGAGPFLTRKVSILSPYIQTDPRGAALYILRPGDVPEGQSADACYSRGICVY